MSARPFFDFIPEIEARWVDHCDDMGVVISKACPTIFQEACISIAMREAVEADGGRLLGNPDMMYRYVLEYGRVMTHGDTTKRGFEFGEMRNCYGNACDAMVRDDVTYVEGFAYAGLVVAQHAWVADDDDSVAYDLTWNPADSRPLPADKWEYLGIPFQSDYVRSVVTEKGTYGLFDWPGVYKELAG